MPMSAFARGWLTATFVVLMATEGAYAQPQDTNPYRVIRDWAVLTLERRPWGGSNGVAIDKDGKSVSATDRCSRGSPTTAR